jgi:hypothetical protein
MWRPAGDTSLATAIKWPVTQTNYVATVIQSADAEWEGESQALVAGARMSPGDVRLKKGVARIHFDGGADLVVEGPATVRVESVAAAALLLGKAVFRIDAASAARFMLSTPTAVLIESRSECGVEVGRQREEIHVFAGQVQRLPKNSPPSAEPQLLATGEARRFTTTGDSLGEPTMLDLARFVRDLPGSDPVAGLLVYEGFD